MTPALDSVVDDLVAANRVLAHEGVVDAFGHVAARHPERPDHFLMSRSRSPELVEKSDIIEFAADGAPIDTDPKDTYVERFIHAAVFAARPDVAAVVHSHARETVPFSITKQPLLPVFHTASVMGKHIPVWDIRAKFGDTTMLVRTLEQGQDLARVLDRNRVVLMRGHGFVAAAASVFEAVEIAIYLPANAAILTTALQFGEPMVLSAGEIDLLNGMDRTNPNARSWEYFRGRAGVPPKP